jgi:hypothetical protein
METTALPISMISYATIAQAAATLQTLRRF